MEIKAKDIKAGMHLLLYRDNKQAGEVIIDCIDDEDIVFYSIRGPGSDWRKDQRAGGDVQPHWAKLFDQYLLILC